MKKNIPIMSKKRSYIVCTNNSYASRKVRDCTREKKRDYIAYINNS